tara:strand:+ start:325 stop:1305 length:981 start_codon:yes stop_codon:yes gene_type:complete
MAQQSDKWHHTMARYLGQNPDTSFLFGIIPGVCREAIGRTDFLYTNQQAFSSDKVYTWSRHHHNKINSNRFTKVQSYYGTAPFLWELGRNAIHQQDSPAGSLFFLPRDDQVTIRDESYKEVEQLLHDAPKPVTVLLPWRKCDIWKQWEFITIPEDYNVIQMSNPITRQDILTKLFLQHQHIYIPWPGTDIYYAEFLHKDVIIYDKLEQYRTKTRDEMDREMEVVLNHLKWGYDYLTKKQKDFFEWTTCWADIDSGDRSHMVTTFLGLDVIKSPMVLFNDLQEHGLLEPDRVFHQQETWEQAYEWILSHKPSGYSTTSKGNAMFELL